MAKGPGRLPIGPARRSAGLVLGLLTLLGTVMTALGITYSIFSSGSKGGNPSLSDQIIGGVLVAFGSALVGAVVSTFVTSQSGTDLLDDTRAIIANALGATFTSDEATLAPLRQDWFHYHVTGARGRNTWRHDIYRFKESPSISSLVTNLVVKDAMGLSHQYRLEGGVRGSRVVIVQTRTDGNEQPAVHVFPNMAESFRAIHCGVIILQDWDGRNLVSKTILSRTQLIGGLREGNVDTRHNPMLDRIWFEGFSEVMTIFPEAGGQQGSDAAG